MLATIQCSGDVVYPRDLEATTQGVGTVLVCTIRRGVRRIMLWFQARLRNLLAHLVPTVANETTRHLSQRKVSCAFQPSYPSTVFLPSRCLLVHVTNHHPLALDYTLNRDASSHDHTS